MVRPEDSGTGMISRANIPSLVALTARIWLCRAYRSISSRVTSYLSATFSAVSPMLMKAAGRPSGFPGNSRGFCVSGWSANLPSGERVLDSTPAHTNAEPSPALMAWKAIRTACSDDAQ